ncbi:MAG: DUF4398 domain-containing protein [Nannocystis sp.]|nr:DUF4398 domain-containing protein [Nannocystis sp.]MBA3546381.1 DUF4398 domain-containing protein [Nannocystis sp.]
MTQRLIIILGVALAAAACASHPPPTDTMANALASMRGAEELGAANVPQASLQLQLAQEQLSKARKLMKDNKNERAHNMALRAANDAELAIALVREARALKAAEQAGQRVEAVRNPEVRP